MNFAHYLDTLLFAVLPFVALVTFLIGTIQRYRQRPFTYSSLSSQLLENKHHFWALVPFHFGIIAVLAGHVVAFLIPRQILIWNSRPLRLYVLEATALAFGLATLIGLLAMIVRRMTDSKVRSVTTPIDWVIYSLLLFQVITGLDTAITYRWGSGWFAALAAPYLWSIARLSPDIALVTPLPWMVKLHIVNAFVLIGIVPFSRLVHILVVPNQYLWRKRQVVRWYGAPAARDRS
ncbi:MAG: respiratory nitrate reductase subunit gamma [Thermoanaerobaculia bacterium]|jgi:nitrate reductase gamma subunit